MLWHARDAVQLRLYGSAVYREFAVGRYPLFPGNAFRLLKQILEFERLEFRHFYQHSVSASEPQIAPGNGTLVTQKCNFRILGSEYLVSELFDFSL